MRTVEVLELTLSSSSFHCALQFASSEACGHKPAITNFMLQGRFEKFTDTPSAIEFPALTKPRDSLPCSQKPYN